jgi:hypothetical protein
MAWVRLDDGYPEHPKVDRVGPSAAWLNVCAWAYCARNLTDGFVPNDRVSRLANVRQTALLVDKLLNAHLWERVEGGYQVHDYLVYNPSREQVQRERIKAVERMRSARSSGEHRAKFAESSSNPIPAPPVNREGYVLKASGPGAREPGPGGPLALPVEQDQPPTQLPNGAQQCPLCPEIYTGTYGEHLEQSPRHKVRAEPEDFGRSQRRRKASADVQENGDISRELAAISERKSFTLEDLPETLRAEHERLQAKERAQQS